MYWLLIITLIQTANPLDRPVVIRIELPTEEICQLAAEKTDYWARYKKYRVETACVNITRT